METDKEAAQRAMLSTHPPTATSSQVASLSNKFKDLTVSNLIQTWLGDGPVLVTEFFRKIQRAAKSGNWTDADKVTIAVLKLSGAAAYFLNSNEEATCDDITFARLLEIFDERFYMKHLDQYQL